ncbi:hypothetical protein HK405_014868 [Cladochytrium tenue]|nr:hypothetical protein HK405_014868 [Cladochytrium tenue]
MVDHTASAETVLPGMLPETGQQRLTSTETSQDDGMAAGGFDFETAVAVDPPPEAQRVLTLATESSQMLQNVMSIFSQSVTGAELVLGRSVSASPVHAPEAFGSFPAPPPSIQDPTPITSAATPRPDSGVSFHFRDFPPHHPSDLQTDADGPTIQSTASSAHPALGIYANEVPLCDGGSGCSMSESDEDVESTGMVVDG